MSPEDLDLIASVAGNPVIALVVTVLLIAAAVSDRVARIGGPLGALARWWQERQLRKAKRDRELAAVNRGTAGDEVSSLKEELRELRTELRRSHNRIVALEQWAYEARITAARSGLDLAELPRTDEEDTTWH